MSVSSRQLAKHVPETRIIGEYSVTRANMILFQFVMGNVEETQQRKMQNTTQISDTLKLIMSAKHEILQLASILKRTIIGIVKMHSKRHLPKSEIMFPDLDQAIVAKLNYSSQFLLMGL